MARESKPGRRLKQVIALQRLSLAIRKHERSFELPYEELRPEVTEDDLGHVIVIKRDSKQLLFYNGFQLKRIVPRSPPGSRRTRRRSASSRSSSSSGTRGGTRRTGSAWAEGAEPIPPGPGNPLGTRWMGISSPYVGIHGTPDAASIGYSASHGCIRMLIPQVEWLFERVDVGTPVFIVGA